MDKVRANKLRALDLYLNEHQEKIPRKILKDLRDIVAKGDWDRD